MRTRRSRVHALLLRQIPQNLPPHLPIRQPRVQRAQIRRKRRHMVPVLRRILPQILPRQLTLRPRLIKRMLQQVIRPNPLLETAPETGICRHSKLHPEKFPASGRPFTAIDRVYPSFAAQGYPRTLHPPPSNRIEDRVPDRSLSSLTAPQIHHESTTKTPRFTTQKPRKIARFPSKITLFRRLIFFRPYPPASS